MSSIKVMADYHCFPIWHYRSDNVGDVDPATLPISEELIVSLLEWASSYDATLNNKDPIKSDFPNRSAKNEFIKKGLELATKLKSELRSVEVYYYHEGIGRNVHI
ncbi:hypothetical protein [Enterovibrio norvegicus]|uniref:hypothetical protein n=1 Tax=Enterovibrio norvegicus TaxID=188144 RepID=UPI000C8308B0|nr:hypothetical protein [Enterovibrio norvegicus]PML75739.1 hypothetical protein BCT69_06295 [Enterovibrio norvegicus]